MKRRSFFQAAIGFLAAPLAAWGRPKRASFALVTVVGWRDKLRGIPSGEGQTACGIDIGRIEATPFGKCVRIHVGFYGPAALTFDELARCLGLGKPFVIGVGQFIAAYKQ